jgi:DNA-binding transcriptional LysR family regulator
VRLGEQVSKDMVSVRIGPDLRFAVVGTKAYLAKHAAPEAPQDLVAHSCINLRLPTHGGLWPWEFERGGRELKVRVDGQLIFNNIFQVRDAALEGFGLAYIPEDLARPYLSKGQLVWVLQEWSPPWSGYHLYYPSRRQSSPAFALVVDALRHRTSK